MCKCQLCHSRRNETVSDAQIERLFESLQKPYYDEPLEKLERTRADMVRPVAVPEAA